MYALTLISILIYAGFGLFLVLSSLFNAWSSHHYLSVVLLALASLGLVLGHFREARLALFEKKEQTKAATLTANDIIIIMVTCLATILTFYVNNNLKLGGTVASALVGLTGPILYPKQQKAIYCGSFAGMAGSIVFENLAWVALAGLLSGLLLAVSKEVYDGFGGKLGAAGLFGTLTTALISGRFIYQAEKTDYTVELLLILYFVIGALLTYWINRYNKTGPVLASAGVGLLVGLLLPQIHPIQGMNYAVSGFCGSFVGMTNQVRLKQEHRLIFPALLGAFIYGASQINFVGLGGKLGTTALAAVVGWSGLIFLFEMIQKRFSKTGTI